MTKKDDGGSAYPHVRHAYDDYKRDYIVDGYECGMSLRDYFAAAALQAIVNAEFKTGREFGFITNDDAAKHSYSYADAMLLERSK